MDYFFSKAHFLVVLMISLPAIIYSQSASLHRDSIASLNQYSGNKKTAPHIKWTWQLPSSVKRAFKESPYKNLFIERIIRYDCSGKIFFKFYLNNGNLLDGDHYDSFLKNDSLKISDSGVIFLEISYQPMKNPSNQFKVSNRDLFLTDPCFYRGFFLSDALPHCRTDQSTDIHFDPGGVKPCTAGAPVAKSIAIAGGACGSRAGDRAWCGLIGLLNGVERIQRAAQKTHWPPPRVPTGNRWRQVEAKSRNRRIGASPGMRRRFERDDK